MKTEYLLEVSDTNYEARKNDEFLSKLRRIQSLLIMNGTLEDSNMGVNIYNYLFEFADDATITDLTNKCSDQIRRYLPDVNLVDLSIETADSPDNKAVKHFILGLAISKSTGEVGSGFISFSADSITGKEASKIIL